METVWIILVRNYHLVKSILTFYTLTWKYKWVKIAQIAHYEMVRPLTAFYTNSFHGSFHCILSHRNTKYFFLKFTGIFTPLTDQIDTFNKTSHQSLIISAHFSLKGKYFQCHYHQRSHGKWFDQTFKVNFILHYNKTRTKRHF